MKPFPNEYIFAPQVDVLVSKACVIELLTPTVSGGFGWVMYCFVCDQTLPFP